VLAAAFAYGLYALAGLPTRAEVRALARRNPDKTGVMRQREEEARRAKRKPRRIQAWVPLSRVSRNLIHAVVVAEDPKFFGHEGVDWDAIKESLEKDIKERRFARGGSTITMQAVKNVFFNTRKSLTRKIREFIVTYWMEQDLSKKRILEIYVTDRVGQALCRRRPSATWKPAADRAPALAGSAMIRASAHVPQQLPARHEGPEADLGSARAGYVKRDVGSLGAEPPADAGDDEGPEPEG
jgi:hypothetical protein